MRPRHVCRVVLPRVSQESLARPFSARPGEFLKLQENSDNCSTLTNFCLLGFWLIHPSLFPSGLGERAVLV